MVGWLLLLLPMTYTWAQNPADFFDHEEERRWQDSLYEANPDISREEMRAFMKEYHQKQADAYYQAYRRRIEQQKKIEKLGLPQNRARLQNNALTQNNVANSAASEGQVPDAVEYAALEAFYNATNGDNWKRKNNWLQGTTSADFANWYGVHVTDGDVSSIQLWYNNLTGSIPSELTDLNIEVLYVHDNRISALSVDFSKFSQLKGLYIGGNLFTEIPKGISTLPQLQNLQIGGNPITSIPSEIGDLISLQELNIAGSRQLSSLPDNIKNLTMC